MKSLALFMLTALFFLTGCSGSNTPANPPLQIGLMPTMDSVAIATAYHMGFFDDFNVDVELVPFSSARDRDAAFRAGALDGATVDLIAVGLMNGAGFPVRATSVTTAHFTLVGRPEFTDVASLEGHTVLISSNTAIDFILDEMLAFNELLEGHVERVEVGNIPTRFEMVRNGQADAALISEPFATMAALEGLAVVTDTFEIDFNPLALAFSLDVIESRHDEIVAFYHAYEMAVDFLNTQPVADYLDFVIDLIGFPPEVVDYVVLPTFLRPRVPEEAVVTKAFDWLVARGLLSQDAPLSDFIYDIMP